MTHAIFDIFQTKDALFSCWLENFSENEALWRAAYNSMLTLLQNSVQILNVNMFTKRCTIHAYVQQLTTFHYVVFILCLCYFTY